jgi:hypothetical protein
MIPRRREKSGPSGFHGGQPDGARHHCRRRPWLTLDVGDYERQDARGDDANWLRGQIELELTCAVASSFRARCSVAWTTDDLVRFHESLRTLLDDLTGTARLTTLEDQIELTVVLKGGKGTISGRVEEHALVRTEFDDIPTDQSQLKMGAARAAPRCRDVSTPALKAGREVQPVRS